MSTLKQQTVSGIKWTMLASILQRIISFGTTVVLARILSPADFGLFALAFVMIDGFGIFKSLGFDSALVRRKDDIEKACNTAFFLIPAMGMVLFTILFFFAPIGARFLNNPEVTPIIRVLAIIFVISCFGKVPQTILYRDMKFKYKTIAEVCASITYCATALILALNKFGVWSLVIAYVLKTFLQVSIEWNLSGWRPKFEFDKTIAWDMFHFGKYVWGSAVVWFLYNNIDNIMIGRILGVTILGYYAIAKNTAYFLNDYLLSRIVNVLYPAYSKIQENTEEIKKIMLKIIKYVSILALPFAFGLSIFSSDAVRIIFGPSWIPAADVLKVLAYVGVFQTLTAAMVPILLARGRSKTDFYFNVLQVVLFAVFVLLLGPKYRLMGIGVSLLLSNMLVFVLLFMRIRRILDVNILTILGIMKPSLCATFFTFLGVLMLNQFLLTQITIVKFLFSFSFAIFLYFFVLYKLDTETMINIKNNISATFFNKY